MALSTVCRILHAKPRFYEVFEDKCLGRYLKDKLLNKPNMSVTNLCNNRQSFLSVSTGENTTKGRKKSRAELEIG